MLLLQNIYCNTLLLETFESFFKTLTWVNIKKALTHEMLWQQNIHTHPAR